MPWPKTGATKYHAQLGLQDKGRAIKGLVVCNNWDLDPLDLNGLALGRPLRYSSYYKNVATSIVFIYNQHEVF